MTRLIEIVMLIGLAAMRLGIPIIVLTLISWPLRLLDRRWQMQAEACRAQEAAATSGAVATHRPCWLLHNCTAENMRKCPASQLRTLPCWAARLRLEGRLPAACPGCELFRSRAAAA